ncbi:MAG: twin-arginine translocase subunit TatC [Kiritimatiellae bacterium]|nr:twin-arginine translocase subunit TatC [Kiritimatiellia bacterium]
MSLTLIKDPDRRDDPPRPLLEHLLALRDMLVFGAVAWAICVVVAFVFSPQVLEWLMSPAKEVQAVVDSADGAAETRAWLQGLDLTSGFSTAMSIAVWGGTALSFPFVVYAILRFVFPALTRREKFILMSILVIGTVLFSVGAGLAYQKTLPLVVTAFQEINRWMGLPVETIRIEGYISIVLKTIIAFGLVFQMPLVIFVLGWFGVVTSTGLREKRRVAIVVAFVLAMFLTPPDPMSQLFMAIPLCLLYEFSIWAVWLKEKCV